MKTIFFGTQPYDRESFDRINADYGIRIKYHRSHLNIDNVPLAQGADAVCIFVNDSADAPTVGELARMGVRLIALRCAGFNNVDLKAAAEHGITVVRVPAYSPYAVAEHAVALMLSLNRRYTALTGVPGTEISPCTASSASICTAKRPASSAREKSPVPSSASCGVSGWRSSATTPAPTRRSPGNQV